MGEHTEMQQKQSTEVLRSVAGDVSLCPGGGHTQLRGTGGQIGLLALTMLSKPVASWLSDGAQISDGREWREWREREWTRQSSTTDVLWQTNARMNIRSLQHKY